MAIQRGVLQGSPLAERLFAIALAHALDNGPAKLREASASGNDGVLDFQGVPEERRVATGRLAYADDLTLWAVNDGDLQRCWPSLVECLETAGLSLNLKKCTGTRF